MFDSELDTFEEDPESCNLEKKWQKSSRILDYSQSLNNVSGVRELILQKF